MELSSRDWTGRNEADSSKAEKDQRVTAAMFARLQAVQPNVVAVAVVVVFVDNGSQYLLLCTDADRLHRHITTAAATVSSSDDEDEDDEPLTYVIMSRLAGSWSALEAVQLRR